MQCQSCGVDKDPNTLEVYPYPETERLTTSPIRPLLELWCEPSGSKKWKEVTVCHHCFHRLDPDMWISQHCWESLSPVVPFDALPDLKK